MRGRVNVDARSHAERFELTTLCVQLPRGARRYLGERKIELSSTDRMHNEPRNDATAKTVAWALSACQLASAWIESSNTVSPSPSPLLRSQHPPVVFSPFFHSISHCFNLGCCYQTQVPLESNLSSLIPVLQTTRLWFWLLSNI